MIYRETYMMRIIPHINKDNIKVFTGMRRCGKTSLLRGIRRHILNSGIPESDILYFELDSPECAHITSAPALFRELVRSLNSSGRTYIFLDEVGYVSDWEKVVFSLSNDYLTDIYISSSDTATFSDDIVRGLGSDCVRFEILPFNFSELMQTRSQRPGRVIPSEEIKSFLAEGGFPMVLSDSLSADSSPAMLRDIVNSVLFFGIMSEGIRKPQLFFQVFTYILEHTGEDFSALSMAKELRASGEKIDNETAYIYIKYLENLNIIRSCPRYDIKKGEILKTRELFYPTDTGLLHAFTGISSAVSPAYGAADTKYRLTSDPASVKTAVFNDLRSKGYTVYSGLIKKDVVDFVGFSGDDRIYVKLDTGGAVKKTGQDEFSSLLSIRDNHPKIIIRTDGRGEGNIDGIELVRLEDFLLTQS